MFIKVIALQELCWAKSIINGHCLHYVRTVRKGFVSRADISEDLNGNLLMDKSERVNM